MGNQADFQELTFSLLRHLKSKKEAILAKHIAELEAVEKEIDAVSVTHRLLQESSSAAETPVSADTKPAVIPIDLHGKSTREACIAIAQQNNGIVRVADAKKACISANILKGSKNTWAIIYTTLHRSKEFEKAPGSGEFRLLSYESPEESAQRSFLQ